MSEATPLNDLTSAQLHAMKIASSKLAKPVRKQLTDGHTYRVDFAARIAGKLTCNAPRRIAHNTTLNPVLVIAYLLAQFGPRKRVQIVNQLLAEQSALRVLDLKKDATKKQPVLDPAAVLETQRLFTESTLRGTKAQAGSVTGDLTIHLA